MQLGPDLKKELKNRAMSVHLLGCHYIQTGAKTTTNVLNTSKSDSAAFSTSHLPVRLWQPQVQRLSKQGT